MSWGKKGITGLRSASEEWAGLTGLACVHARGAHRTLRPTPPGWRVPIQRPTSDRSTSTVLFFSLRRQLILRYSFQFFSWKSTESPLTYDWLLSGSLNSFNFLLA